MASASKSIFLSHSHKDRDLAKGLINYLAPLGLSLYVDWQDSTMPRITSRETAQNIKRTISELDFFLILATPNALESRWVPWEIGVADQAKSHAKMAIMPVADSNGNFQGNEYLLIYNRIELDSLGGLLMRDSDNSWTVGEVKSWLAS
ncbi:MAG: hypothetical protein A2X29_06980 [Elusimicrobia bacterium GWA2_64_40]|nr:MAG: hypothetical protein A2X29_06980 [Elusimicrobia bacterium GWA2_64_40]